MIDSFAFKDRYSIDDLLHIMQCLRAPGGCPWDAAQTHESIKKNLIEETYEVIEAINKQDKELLLEELGDLLLQVIFYAQLAEEDGYFTMDDVMNGLGRKLVRRHPHVFGDEKADSPEEALALWRSIKKKEREEGYR